MTVIISINNSKYAHIQSNISEEMDLLNKHLSFRQPGFEYSPAFQNGYWNGLIHLIDKNNYFQLGLLDTVKNFLQKEKIDYKVLDYRKVADKAEPMAIDLQLQAIGKIPRPYQIETVKTLLQYDRGIAKLATGAGKSNIIAILTAALNKTTLILVISIDLLEQFYSLFTELFNEPIGRIGDGQVKIERINIATLWTVAKSIGIKDKDLFDENEGYKEKFDQSSSEKIRDLIVASKVIIFDECHLASCASLQKLYKETNAEHLYGFSATPKKDGEDAILVNAVFGDVKVNIPASTLIEQKYLIKPIIKFLPIPQIRLSTSKYAGVYKEYIVENEIRNNIIVNAALKLVENNYKTLILFRVINHGKILFDLCQNKGLKCGLLWGNDKLERREEIKRQLIDGEIDLIIASTIFECGVDIPCLNALILASGGKSSVKTLQRVGRVLRPAPNKTHCRVIDFYDNAKYLRNHSKARLKIYESEPGFEILK